MTDKIQKYQNEMKEMNQLFGTFFPLWSSLESNLSLLLSEILRIDWEYSNIGFAAYYSPTSFDARITTVNNCIEFLFNEQDDLIFLKPHWEKISSRINTLKPKRNAIAHGAVTLVYAYGTNHARLTYPLFDIRMPKTLLNNELPGMSLNDMKNVIKNLEFCIKATDLIRHSIYAYRKGDVAFQDKCSELEDYLQAEYGDHTGDQTPLEP